jgi:hypothetical protein
MIVKISGHSYLPAIRGKKKKSAKFCQGEFNGKLLWFLPIDVRTASMLAAIV